MHRAAIVAIASLALYVGSVTAQGTASSTAHFGVMGGATVPLSDLKPATNVGFNAGGLVEITSPRSPLGFRIDAQYQRLKGKTEEVAGNDFRRTDFRIYHGSHINQFLLHGAPEHSLQLLPVTAGFLF